MLEINNAISLLQGKFVKNAEEFAAKIPQIKAFVFDWDGVFNSGEKSAEGSSLFSEVGQWAPICCD